MEISALICISVDAPIILDFFLANRISNVLITRSLLEHWQFWEGARGVIK